MRTLQKNQQTVLLGIVAFFSLSLVTMLFLQAPGGTVLLDSGGLKITVDSPDHLSIGSEITTEVRVTITTSNDLLLEFVDIVVTGDNGYRVVVVENLVVPPGETMVLGNTVTLDDVAQHYTIDISCTGWDIAIMPPEEFFVVTSSDFTIVFTGGAPAPTVYASADKHIATVGEDTVFTISWIALDADSDLKKITLLIKDGSSNAYAKTLYDGTAIRSINGEELVGLTSETARSATYTIIVTATDEGGNIISDTVVIVVNWVEDSPTTTTVEGTSITTTANEGVDPSKASFGLTFLLALPIIIIIKKRTDRRE